MPVIENEVIETDPQQPVVPDKGQGKEGKEDNVTISRAELESIKRESQEREQAARYWSGLHQQSKTAAEPESEDIDPSEFLDEEDVAGQGVEDDTPEKLVNDLAAKGVAGLKSRGFITAKDAQKLAADVAVKVSRELIGRERTKDRSDNTIMTEFRELKDEKSDLFKETAKLYAKAVAMDPNVKKTPAALYLAASAARELLKAKAPARQRNDDDDYNRYEPETDRQQRIDAQDGRSRGRGVIDATDDMLGDEARDVIRQMGITEAEYKESQKQLSGGRGRRK